jgi:hypothetical protein
MPPGLVTPVGFRFALEERERIALEKARQGFGLKRSRDQESSAVPCDFAHCRHSLGHGVGDRDKVLAAGFDGYLAKPISPETFVGEVEQFLQGHRGSTPHSIPPHPHSPLPSSKGKWRPCW